MYSRAFLASVSRDRAAAEAAARFRAEAHRSAPWQRARRKQAEHRATQAERQAVEAGIDFGLLPRPAPGRRRAPDRSSRQRLGRRMPPPGSPVPGGLGALLRRRPAQAPGPPPSASVTPEGGGAGALEGRPVPGEMSGSAALGWLRRQPTPEATLADGSTWYRAADGSLWHRDAQGAYFALSADGSQLLPISAEGLLYTRDEGGTWHTCLADGTPLSLRDDGQLITRGSDGSLRLLADDGLFYLAAPGALYPIAENGEVLTELAIDSDGLELGSEPDGSMEGLDVHEGFWT